MSNVQARRPVREFFRRIPRWFDDRPMTFSMLIGICFAIIVGVNLIPFAVGLITDVPVVEPAVTEEAPVEVDTVASPLEDILAFVVIASLIFGAVAFISGGSSRSRASSSPTPRPSFRSEILWLLRTRRGEQ